MEVYGIFHRLLINSCFSCKTRQTHRTQNGLMIFILCLTNIWEVECQEKYNQIWFIFILQYQQNFTVHYPEKVNLIHWKDFIVTFFSNFYILFLFIIWEAIMIFVLNFFINILTDGWCIYLSISGQIKLSMGD